MTSPGPSVSPTPPRPTNGNGLEQPQPRRFGSANVNLNNARSPPRSTSNTPRSSTPTLVPPSLEARRTRSSSSASLVSQDGSEAAGANNSFGKAQAWLSTWAPRGEGRTREFLAHTVNGVASVASTVSSGIGGTVNTLEQRAGLGNRPNSFHAVQDTQAQIQAQAQATGGGTGGSGVTNGGGAGLRQVASPPGPFHTASTPALPASQMARKPPQPANSSRLAPVRSPSPPPSTAHRPSLSMSNTSSTSSLTLQPGPSTNASRSNSTSHPHGPSHLNPNPKSRGSFSHPLPAPNHVRSPSMGYNPSSSPTPSRSSSTANGIWKGAGMPYKLGFQPAGVKNDRTNEFQNDRKRMAEEKEKEEGRLGRRWAKVNTLSREMGTRLCSDAM